MPGEPAGIELNSPGKNIVAGGGESSDPEAERCRAGAEMIVYNNKQRS